MRQGGKPGRRMQARVNIRVDVSHDVLNLVIPGFDPVENRFLAHLPVRQNRPHQRPRLGAFRPMRRVVNFLIPFQKFCSEPM